VAYYKRVARALTRHPRDHLDTFVYGHDAEYLKTINDLIPSLICTGYLGMRLSNHALAVKPYLLLRANGTDKYRMLVQRNIDHINYLADQLQKQPNIEICAPVESNIVCFRYKPKGLNMEQSEKLNKAILQELWKISMFVISDTHIKGKYMLRACNVNHRSCREDFDWLTSEVNKQGARA